MSVNDISGKNLPGLLVDQIWIWFDWFLGKKIELKTKACSFPVTVMMGNLDNILFLIPKIYFRLLKQHNQLDTFGLNKNKSAIFRVGSVLSQNRKSFCLVQSKGWQPEIAELWNRQSGLSLLQKLCLQEPIKMGICISNGWVLALTSKMCRCSSLLNITPCLYVVLFQMWLVLDGLL